MMFESFYTTKMSGNAKKLSERFSRIQNGKQRVSKTAVFAVSLALIVSALGITAVMAMYDRGNVSETVPVLTVDKGVQPDGTSSTDYDNKGAKSEPLLVADATDDDRIDSDGTTSSTKKAEPVLVPDFSHSRQIDLIWPCDSNKITQSFGIKENPVTGITVSHDGIDIEAEKGENVYASISGVVTESGFDAEKGNYLVIADGDISTVYAQLESIAFDVGDSVSQGEIVATVGNTGKSTGPHLHFEVRVGGKSVDAAAYMNSYE